MNTSTEHVAAPGHGNKGLLVHAKTPSKLKIRSKPQRQTQSFADLGRLFRPGSGLMAPPSSDIDFPFQDPLADVPTLPAPRRREAPERGDDGDEAEADMGSPSKKGHRGKRKRVILEDSDDGQRQLGSSPPQ